MSMATRCMACGTIFRVVQDQLKVSEGWVRCGRCNEVFNAIEGLFDLERDAPPPWQPGSAHLLQRESRHEDAGELDEDDRIASRFFRPEPDEEPRDAAATIAPLAAVLAPDASGRAAAPPVHREIEPGTGTADTAAGESTDFDAEAPPFVRAADDRARWASPRMRLGLSLAALLLAAALALQAAHHFRDDLAVDRPALRPLLAGWCALAGCTLEPPRRIEDITVEHTALTRAAPDTDAYRLSVTLRNRAEVPVRMPSVDLALTDTAGQLVARRALAPADFSVDDPVMPPGGEAALQVLLAGDPRVSGYTVEVFYP